MKIERTKITLLIDNDESIDIGMLTGELAERARNFDPSIVVIDEDYEPADGQKTIN